ncbi:heterokaryon incompatibility protein-domain-containing protein, partial [Boeremia exigua]|uniref:heterokaryon incompatibility protein-domain-containing protein n=1 Tax=Boeremia exigua TaxID=749465 RepID=UPI001E8E632F
MELLVIDCETRALRRLPLRAEYLTLSYVWGATARHDVAAGSHPGKLEKGIIPWNVPSTINDSIVVCRKLGYRYLWVDRYCIPQDDPEERRRQIQRMDVIFQNSTLTIVACAGIDPQYGLPGVSKSREQSPSISLQGAGYLQRTPKIEEIKKSVWAGRGWTYQETILSQMRLYFTDRQLYFESENAVDCEWITLAGANTIRIPGWEFSKNRQMAKPGYIYLAISEFSERSLSFQSDSLNAMSGIFAAFERK